MTTAAPSPRPSIRLGSVRIALVLVVVAAGLAAAGAGYSGGAPASRGVGVGAAVVVGFFVFGAFCTGVATAYAPSTALLVALLTYTLQVVLLPFIFVALDRSGVTPDRVDLPWVAGTVIGGTLLWMVGLLVDAVRSCPPPTKAPTPRPTQEAGA